jgi:hypothetical protein
MKKAPARLGMRAGRLVPSSAPYGAPLCVMLSAWSEFPSHSWSGRGPSQIPSRSKRKQYRDPAHKSIELPPQGVKLRRHALARSRSYSSDRPELHAGQSEVRTASQREMCCITCSCKRCKNR